MQEPRWEDSRFIASFRSVETSVERFPSGCIEYGEAFDDLARMVDNLHYEGYILSPRNNYQVNLTFDQCVVDQMCLASRECISQPRLSAPQEVAEAVGRYADLLLRAPQIGGMIVVEIEKANEEKVLRDVVKMLLFLDAGQAELAALICPRNYVHSGGAWRVFDTARQVLRAFIHVTHLPESQAKRLA